MPESEQLWAVASRHWRSSERTAAAANDCDRRRPSAAAAACAATCANPAASTVDGGACACLLRNHGMLAHTAKNCLKGAGATEGPTSAAASDA